MALGKFGIYGKQAVSQWPFCSRRFRFLFHLIPLSY